MSKLSEALKNKHRLQRLRGGSLADVFIYEDIVVKRYEGKDRRGVEKSLKEIAYLESIPEQLRDNFPPVLEKVVSKSFVAFSIPYYKTMPSLSAHLIKKTNPQKVWTILKKALHFADTNIYTISKQKTTKGYLEETQFSRIIKALEILSSFNMYKNLVDSNFVWLNGEKLRNYSSLLSEIEGNSEIMGVIAPKYQSYFHGNFHLDNILTDFEKFIFVDPRGELLGSEDYDKSKMFCHLYMRYDEIHSNYFNLEEKSPNNISLKLNDLNIGNGYDLIQEKYLSYLRNRYDDKQNIDKKLLILSSLHALSFSSYHARKKRPNTDRVKAYYLCGIKLLNDAINSKNIHTQKAIVPY